MKLSSVINEMSDKYSAKSDRDLCARTFLIIKISSKLGSIWRTISIESVRAVINILF